MPALQEGGGLCSKAARPVPYLQALRPQVQREGPMTSIEHKRSVTRFHDGLAWLMQIAMFLALGLLVFPSHLLPIVGLGLLASLFLMLIARPVSVLVTLAFSDMKLNEKLMISWVGLRGAVPIVLATFPLLAGMPRSEMIFDLVFFIVLTSILLQG